MFNLGDRTFKSVPQALSKTILDRLVQRIDEYLADVRGPFLIALHGGEPTLWSEESFAHLGDRVRKLRDRGHQIEVSLQTNLYQPLSPTLIKILRSMGVKIGVSLDGPLRWNDLRRVNHAGRGSYARVIGNLSRLMEHDSDIVGGILAVADPDIPPADFFDWLKALPVKRSDVLWPIEFSQDNPPWRRSSRGAYRVSPRYGSWMAEVFRLWWEEDDPSLEIRSFKMAVEVLLGGTRHTDSMVNDKLEMFVVNTDGRVEYPDYLRATSAGARPTGLSIDHNSIHEIARERIFSALSNLQSLIPADCKLCRHKMVCGGGFLPGRTSANTVIAAEPSVLCHDQERFFDEVQRLVQNELMNVDPPSDRRVYS